MILLVPPAEVAGVWPQVLPLLLPAIEIEKTHAPGDVLRTILGGAARLYVDRRGDTIISAAVVEIVTYPLMRRLRVWLGGGEPMDVEAYRERLFEWGRFEGCREAEIVGRTGWARRTKAQRRIFVMRDDL